MPKATPPTQTTSPRDSGTWETIDAFQFSLEDCYYCIWRIPKRLPRDTLPKWADMYNKILQYFNGAVASKDSQEITRAAKWFFLAHQLIYRPPRHPAKRRKRTIVYKARLNSFLRGDFRDLLVDFVADRGLAIVRAEHQGPRDPGDPIFHFKKRP